MSAIAPPEAPPDTGGANPAWERRIRPAIDAIRESTPRALLVGNAGSGKSTALRRLRTLLDLAPRDSALLHGPSAQISAVPTDHVLLLDDLHLLDTQALAQVHDRINDPTAALIVTIRPWPTNDRLRDLARRLERRIPAIVLGHVSRSDLLDAAAEQSTPLEPHCAEHILDITRGVAWLVWAALRHHDTRDCADDPSHRELERALQEQIAHRLDGIAADLRRTIEELCTSSAGASADPDDMWVLRGHAEGLLLRNGQPVPVVRSAVRATIPLHRLIDLHERHPEAFAHELAAGSDAEAWSGMTTDGRVAAAMVRQADVLLGTAPRRASELYRAAIACGAEPGALGVRRAVAAWSAGDVDATSEIVDAPGIVPSAPSEAATLTAITAAVWAARGMMEQADAAYRAAAPTEPIAADQALIAAIGVGTVTAETSRPLDAAPSALGVAMGLLRRGLRRSVEDGADESVLADLVRAAEMYSAARADGPICELPAVIAAIMAMNLGGISTAHGVIDDALANGHGGDWARPRLLLWRAWIAVQRGLPAEANDALQRAVATPQRLSARDALLADAVRVALARRYADASGLEEAWRAARGSILRADIDLYLLHPLGELICSAARVGDTARVQAPFARALKITAALGDPPLWTAHLRWAGIQEGILLSRPTALAPHAKALVAASTRSRVAAVMAKAGRTWTSVLAGTVDSDAVEDAAEGLASIGLRWDAARLAGHGAARATDRKISARLLACARELHPTDGTRRLPSASDDPAATAAAPSSEEVLSERELEVARLVVQGKTYAQIGETIFISPRTAEHHIAHIRRRLGAESRSELLSRLRVLLDEDGTARGGRGDQGGPP